MADNYDLLASTRTVLVRSPTLVEDVEELHVITKPSGTQFVRDVAYSTWTSGAWKTGIETIATNIEHIFSVRDHVISAAPVQLVSSQGLITNAVQFLVTYTNDNGGQFSDTVTIPVQNLHDDTAFDSFFDPVTKVLAAAANS